MALRDPRLTPGERMILAAAEKLAGDNGRVVLDAETLSLLAHPDVVLELGVDGAR
jgi:hypothetical protein